MAIYKIQAPDGTVLRIEGPDDASEQDVMQAAQEQYSQRTKASETKVSPEDQAKRDAGRVEILKQELAKANARAQQGDERAAGDVAALVRELRRAGVNVSSSPRAAQEPSTADTLRQKLAALEQAGANPLEAARGINPVEAAQLGASGIAAAGGYKASPVLGRMVQRAQEAGQRPPFSAPGTPMAPPVPPAGGLIPTDPQNVRIQTGTIVDDTTGRARQTGYTERTAQEAARRQELARIQQELVAKRLVPPGNPMAQMPGMTSTPGGILVPSSTVYPTAPPIAPPAAPPRVSPLTQVSEMFRTIGRTGANLFADVMRSRAMGALGAGSAAYQGMEALKQLRAGQDEEAALSGMGALGGALMVIPTVPTALVGGALSAAPYAYRRYKQIRAEPPPQKPTEEELIRAQRPAFTPQRSGLRIQ